MSKLVLNNITSGYASTAALNANNDAIEAALENTLSLDGTSPNSMNADLDMNGYAILNRRATTGEENFLWKGVWVTGTVYAANNLVYAPEGTEEGNTLICVTAHTAGATLDGDAANWAVFAQRGAPGASGGDVVGPASATADSLARFNGTTGKLLKNGAVIGTDVQAYSANLVTFATKTFIDDDTMATASSTAIPSSESIKAYADTKVSSVTGTAPVVSSGGVTPTISMAAATASVNGYMTSTYAAKLDGIAAGANVGVSTDVGVSGIGMMAYLYNDGIVVVPAATISGSYLLSNGSAMIGTWRNIDRASVSKAATGNFQRIA
jgi:hypothetical protein